VALCYLTFAAVNLVGVALNITALQWATKPLLAPTLAYAVAQHTRNHKNPMVVGLLCAGFGDTVLEINGLVAFIIGMLSFLAMQVCYIRAFRALGTHPTRSLWVTASLLWLTANAVLAPRIGVLAVPVAVYSGALVAMAATAATLGRIGAIGGTLFVLSDGLIGIGAAGAGFSGRGLIIMATYTIAQALLTLSYLARFRPRETEADAPALWAATTSP
jgi:uncharacterized membrane protein YhhN